MTDPFVRYVVSLVPVPGQSRSEAQIRAHVAYLKQLEARGLLLLAGPFEDGNGGMLILSADSLEQAREIAAADPFVREGRSTAEVRAWLLSSEENNHLGMG